MSFNCKVCGPLTLVKDAKLPRCQVHKWMPEPMLTDEKYWCKEESVRRVKFYPCNSEKPMQAWMCRKDAELVERYNEREGVRFD